MRRISGLFLFAVAAGLIGMLYWLTPHLLHAQSQIVNLIELMGVSIIVAGALVLLLVGLGISVGGGGTRPVKQAQPSRATPLIPQCEGCGTTQAQLYSASKDVMLCVKCATAIPGAHGTLVAVSQGVTIRGARPKSA